MVPFNNNRLEAKPMANIQSFNKSDLSLDRNYFNGAYEIVHLVVNSVVKEFGCLWIKPQDVDDLVQNASIHLWTVMGKYDPSKGASVRTWVAKVARNYTISEIEKLYRTASKEIDIERLKGFNKEGKEIEAHSSFIDFTKAPDFAWAAEGLGFDLTGNIADSRICSEEEKLAAVERSRMLQKFISTHLSDPEKELLDMVIAKTSREEIVSKTGLSRCNIDTRICRLRSKILSFMKSSEYLRG